VTWSFVLSVLSLLAAAVIGLAVRALSSGVTDAKTSSWAGIICGGIVAAVGLVNSVLTGIKTVQEIRLNQRKISDLNRRVVEAPPMRFESGPKINLGIKSYITGESEERRRRS
jgi:hypothetical protein